MMRYLCFVLLITLVRGSILPKIDKIYEEPMADYNNDGLETESPDTHIPIQPIYPPIITFPEEPAEPDDEITIGNTLYRQVSQDWRFIINE